MGIFDSVKSTFNSLTDSDTWKGHASNALNYGATALSFVSPFAGAAANLGLGIWNNHQQYKQAKGLSNHQSRLDKQYNEWLIPYQLRQEYEFASRYAKNSPKWNVKGLRKAGLNPILAVNGGFSGGNAPHASVGSVGSGGSTHPNLSLDPLTFQHLKNMLEQNESLRLDNELKADNLKTSKSENEVKRLKAEAEAALLRPVNSGVVSGDGKETSVVLPSKTFKALQKSIADDYDLRSEKYLRETIDSVMRYGTDVLRLLPAFRRKEIMDTIQKTVKTSSKGKKSTVETYIRHRPRK